MTLFLVSGLIACAFPVQCALGQGSDRFIDRMPTIRGRDNIARESIRVADQFLAIKDSKEASAFALRAFEAVRRAGDIVNENIFVSKFAFLVPEDSAVIPLTVTMMDRLVADNDSLLPAVTDKDLQRRVINQLAESASAYVYARRTEISIRYESMAIRLNERLHQHATFPYQNLSFLYTTHGRLKDAFALALDAMRIAETPDGVVDAAGYEALARVYFMTEDADKCAEFSKKAFDLFVKDPSAVEYAGTLLFRYIQVMLQQQKAAEALGFLRSIDGSWSMSSMRGADRANWPLSVAECFRVLHEPDSAERYYAKAIALKPPIAVSGPWFWISTNVCLATFYTENRRYVEAGRLLDTLLGKNFRGLLPTSFLERTLLLRYQVDSALRSYPEAMAVLREYQKLHDSLTNYRLNRQLADLGVRAETEKTESALRQERIIRNGLIAGAVLLAIFAGVLYNRWRVRRRMALRLEKLSARQQKLLGEKEWLLREIHHRVKNNLQIIISLLNMQAGQLKDEIAVSAFEEIGTRVNTISLVHKKLYQETQDMASIDMRDYIRELVGFLKEGIGSRRNIVFGVNVEQVILDPTQCVPLGLILNEAITNAIKYAFRGEGLDLPTISISLKEEPEGWITLVVADNGTGLPASFDAHGGSSLGLQLIRTLTQQLDGSLEIVNQRGLSLVIRFPWAEPMTVRAANSTAHSPGL